MTTYNKTQLKTFFAQGDIPTGTDYANFIDSQVNIAETSEQAMAGNLNTPKLITSLVSAAVINTPIINAATVSATTLNIATINSTTVNATTVSAATKVVTADVSATSTVYSSALSTQVGVKGKVTIVSAAGSTRAGATAMDISYMIRGQGVADGQTTGFALAVPVPGLVQYFINDTAASANLYPGGTDYVINGLASGAAFALAAKTSYTIQHYAASAYTVK